MVYTCPSFRLSCTDRRRKQKYAKFKILTQRTIIIKYDERKYNVYDIANLHPQYKSQQTLRKGWNRDKVECFCIEHPSVCKRRNHSVQKVIRLWILLAYEKLMYMYEKKELYPVYDKRVKLSDYAPCRPRPICLVVNNNCGVPTVQKIDFIITYIWT